MKLSKPIVRVFYIVCVLFMTFEVQAQITAEADCPDAYTICDASQSYYFEVNGPGSIDDAYGELGIFCQSNTSFTMFESSSAWFTFTPKYTGEFGFYILPEVEEDWEYILFGNNPDCTDLQSTDYHIACNTHNPGNSVDAYTGIGPHPTMGGNGTGISGFWPYITVTAGERYVLFITPYLVDGGFNHRATLTFQGGLIDTYGADAFEQVEACTLGVGENDLDVVQVYPNPVGDVLRVKTRDTYTKLIVYDLTGKTVLEQDYTSTIDTSRLKKGLYVLKLIAYDNHAVLKKIVKE